MPRDGSGVYSSPPGTHGTPNTTILSANYNSNVDDVATDLNTPRPIVAGGTGATTAAGALTALGAVAKAGDTMTGNLAIQKSFPAISFLRTDSGAASLAGYVTGNKLRWLVEFGSADAETGSNAGSDFDIARYNDAGSYIDTPFLISRANGSLTAKGGMAVGPPPLAGVGGVISIGYPGGGVQYGVTLRPAADNTIAISFKNSADTLIGSIGVSTTATTYNTSSDERLKEDLKTFDAGRVIDDTEVYDFAWRSTGERSYGVLAQQAVDVYPAAVTYEEKQDWWGIDYSKYVPVLLQELKALRARVAALEGGGLSGKPA